MCHLSDDVLRCHATIERVKQALQLTQLTIARSRMYKLGSEPPDIAEPGGRDCQEYVRLGPCLLAADAYRWPSGAD
jgi:hypothetical protein